MIVQTETLGTIIRLYCQVLMVTNVCITEKNLSAMTPCYQ